MASGHCGPRVPLVSVPSPPVLLLRLLAHVSPKRESLFLKEEGECDEAPRAQRLLLLSLCARATGVLSVLLIIASIY